MNNVIMWYILEALMYKLDKNVLIKELLMLTLICVLISDGS